MFIEKWNTQFLRLAAFYAQWSKDPSTKVGAVIVRNDKIQVGQGFNGFVKGADDSPVLYADRAYKYPHIIHGEMNALIHSNTSVIGCTLFTWPFCSCTPCASIMLQAGIKDFVFPAASEDILSRWGESIAFTKVHIASCGGTFLEMGKPEDYQ